MKREGRPFQSDFILHLQLFNTPGNEIAPWSDVIGEYFQGRVRHLEFPFVIVIHLLAQNISFPGNGPWPAGNWDRYRTPAIPQKTSRGASPFPRPLFPARTRIRRGTGRDEHFSTWWRPFLPSCSQGFVFRFLRNYLRLPLKSNEAGGKSQLSFRNRF